VHLIRRVVIVLAVASVACGGGGDKAPTTPSNTTNPGGTGGTGGTGGMGGGGGATANTVGVYDNEFTPPSLTVTAGMTVTWEFHGSYSVHNVTFDNGSGTSPDMMTGTYVHTFNSVGSFPYRCRIHGAAMSGTIVVQ
jgi:plastocyanin